MKQKLTPWLLLAPFLLVMGVFLVGLCDGVLQGLGHIPAFGLRGASLGYIKEALAGTVFWQSLGISLYVASVSATVSVGLATVLSYALVTLKKTHGVLYALIKIPLFVPWMVTGLLMGDLLGKTGWLARVFYTFGMQGAVGALSGLLHQPHQLGVILAFVWACTPFACFFILTVMDNISATLGEAAQTLGAGFWQRFFCITLPLCRGAIQNIFLIVLLSCFGSYELPALLGMTTPRALPVEIYYQYSHYDLRHRPHAMALNTLMLVCALALAGLVKGAFVLGRGKGGAKAGLP